MNEMLEVLRSQPEGLSNSENDSDDSDIIVHLMKEEAKALDGLQGGPSFDPETGIREYRQVWDIIQTTPEIKEIFEAVAQDLGHEGSLDHPLLRNVYEETPKDNAPFQPAPSDSDPQVADLAKQGINGDTIMAIFPEGLADFLDELRGARDINPNTGLRQYGFGNFMKSVVRVGATIGGAILGGPVGAVAGNALGRIGTGQKAGDSLMSSLPNALYGAGAMAGLKGLGWLTQGAQGLGGLSGGASSLGNLLSGNSSFGLSSLLGSGAPGTPGVTTAPGATASPQASGAGNWLSNLFGGSSSSSGTSAVASSFGSSFKDLLSPTTAMLLGSAYLKKRGEKEEIEDIKRQNRERSAQFEGASTHPSESRGLTQFLTTTSVPYNYVRDDGSLARTTRPSSIYGSSAEAYAHGGGVHGRGNQGNGKKTPIVKPIQGAGKGQDDKVYKDVPEGSYILDATTVSSFGDGSTGAGYKDVTNGATIYMKKSNPKLIQHSQKKAAGGRMIPAALSDGEIELSPEFVTLLGKGSNRKGSQILKAITKDVREHKTSNGNRLPPRAKDFLSMLERYS